MISDSHGLAPVRKIALALSISVAALGVLVLVGWAYNIAALISVLPGLAQMKPNTALTFLLGGAALVLLSRRNQSKGSRWAVRVLAAIVLAIGVFTLAEYFFHWNPGFDQWLFYELVKSADTVIPARMSPATAFCSLLVGWALLAAAQPVGGRFQLPLLSALSVAIIVIGGLSFAGYLALAVFKFHWWNNTGVAVHTALAYMVMGLALLILARTEGKIIWVLEPKITLGFWFAIAILLLAAGISYSFTNQLLESDASVSVDQHTLKEIQQVMTGMADLESSQRGYIITGDESLLVERPQVKTTISQSLAVIRQLTTDSVEERHWLDQLTPLVTQRIDFGEQTILVRRQQGFPAAQQVVASGTGIALTAQIKDLLNKVQNEEYAQSSQWEQQSTTASTSTQLLQPLGVFLDLTLLSLGVSFLNAGMTEREQSEKALRTREEQFSLFIEHSPVALAMFDRDMHYLAASRRWLANYGITDQNVIGRSHYELFPEIPARWREVHQRCLAGAVESCEEEPFKRTDGKVHWIRWEVRPWRTPDGQIGGLLIFSEDITGRKRDEDARNRLAAIVEYSSDAIIGKDLQSIVTSWNKGAQKIFGYTAEEMVGRSIMQLIPPGRQGEEVQILELIKRGKSVEHFETVRLCKNGIPLDVSVTVSPIKDATGTVVGASKIVRDITDRKRAENVLEESERRFRELLENVELLAITLDKNATVTFCNDYLLKVTGWQRKEAMGHDWFARFTPGSDPLRRTRFLENIEAGKIAQRIEASVLTRQGDLRDIVWSNTMLRDATGQVVGVASIGEDVTEQKRVTESLKLFRSLVDQSSDAFAVIDPVTARFLDVNEKICADLGYTRQEMLALRVMDVSTTVTEKNWAQIVQGDKEVGSRIIESFHVRKDGTIFPIEVHTKWIKLDREYIVSVIRDITERKKTEEVLRESEARFRQLAENINEVFWITDPVNNKLLYISPAFEAVWGRTCQSFYDSPRKWLEAIHPDDRTRVLEDISGKQARGEYNVTYRILRPDGSVRWIHDRAYPIRNEAGQVYRIVGTAEDITGYRKLEEQYRQAQKMEALGTLAGGIAHDFNNILSAMNGYTELAKMRLGQSNPKVCESLCAVLQAGGRATGLVRQILTFSRKEDHQLQVVQLRDIVEETLKLLRATIPTTIEFNIYLAKDLPPVLADATQIHQILMNLGTNAGHAMKDHTGRLQVRLENFVADAHTVSEQPRLKMGRYVRLSVSDTGTGMDKATMERIFEPFFTTKVQGEGTGLGLAVVHGIMQSHGGVITVYSQPGEGTTFHLYFPPHSGEITKAAISSDPLPDGDGKRILYVDDEGSLAQLGKQTLEMLGFQVEAMTNVMDALKLVEAAQRFDLVITDQTMPGMTGTDFAAHLQKIRPGLPIILATGYSAGLTRERLRTMGIRELLLKPQSIQSLTSAVQRALTEKESV